MKSLVGDFLSVMDIGNENTPAGCVHKAQFQACALFFNLNILYITLEPASSTILVQHTEGLGVQCLLNHDTSQIVGKTG